MEQLPPELGILSDPHILQQLPPELVQSLHTSSTPSAYLDGLSVAALSPNLTDRFFVQYEPIFVDLAARWIHLDPRVHSVQATNAISRILPLARYLKSFANLILSHPDGVSATLSRSNEATLLEMKEDQLSLPLLSVFRLLSFDVDTFSSSVSPTFLQLLFQHSSLVVRYLAIRCFCLYMHAADSATQATFKKYVGEAVIEGSWEGRIIDYRFLSLWEEKRWARFERDLVAARLSRDDGKLELWINQLRPGLSDHTADIGGVLVPTTRSVSDIARSSLVKTPTVQQNLHKLGRALLSFDPVLLVGLAGSGKSSLVVDAANKLGQLESMITLHLNEQTDSKSLLGVYSTSSQAGTFSWQPGVLTKAAREGRWVLIEDLDRAPSEVLGLILPLIEKRELVIPSRKEYIRCAEGFRIIATMRSSINAAGKETVPGSAMLGNRLWNRVSVAAMSLEEVQELIVHKFPLLSARADMIMKMYNHINSTFDSSLARKSIQGRAPGLRDLIKFCRRTERRLKKIGCETGLEPVSEGISDEIFMDAVDCFAAYLSSKPVESAVIEAIAEELHMSPQRMAFCLSERTPAYADEANTLSIGREICLKTKSLGSRKPARTTFAATRTSLKTMEQVASALQLAEPVLLVGETGIGKTAVVQQLATLLRQRLTVVNLSQQSESTDLLGGHKPVNLRSMAVPLVDEFNILFESTFSARKNQKFLASVAKRVAASNWVRLITILNEAVRMASSVFSSPKGGKEGLSEGEPEQPSKKRKLDDSKYIALRQKWDGFASELREFETRVAQGDTKFAFAFVQGKIVKALRNGEWVLLDEINLASPDTLESIASLLHHGPDGRPSVLLSEAGDVERVIGHPNFRIFGAMNPATDAGKRDLAPGLRSRFTELYVQSPDSEVDDLLNLIDTYLGPLTTGDDRAAPALAYLYLDTKRLTLENKLTDGAGQKPHFSIRTLVRALIYVRDQAHVYGLRRAIFEGFCMSFLTLLSKESERLVAPLLEKHIFGTLRNSRSVLSQTPRAPEDGAAYVNFKHYWMRQGAFPVEAQPHYIITPFIERNLMNLVRASSTRRFPILLQGPTSSGKTSMVEYLAKISGNRFVRINNHEHTDLQEYLGSYVSGEDGSLRYQEGVLVEALRNGYWIVLDELNLAPTDVLEALNRLLDDNRELFIPETQEVVHPHPNFMLFATQNPAGLYGGRKVLSRAFRNRFLELHFDDIPEDELEFILKERSQIAPSFCSRIVSVYKRLSLLRQSSRLFEQRNSFATLRDLFRWALRRADDREQLAINGFMLLAERVRNPQERAAVKQVIEEVMKVKLDEDIMYGSANLEARLRQLSATTPRGVVWTKAMRRLFILVSQAIEHNEPVLLVGETGCGKTQLCQAVAEIRQKQLLTINAHVNLETGDLIGAQRPVRNRSAIEHQLHADLSRLLKQVDILDDNTVGASLEDLIREFSALAPEKMDACDSALVAKIRQNITRSRALFEWSDGSLVTAMKTGQYFLLDEVSLADDSVLERLNSVLESHRSLLLAEKGPNDSLVVAEDGFQFLSTMNPGGDYGKRELSAALRNRLTEIWVPLLSEDEDILPILDVKLVSPISNAPRSMLGFAKWFNDKFHSTSSGSLSVRDLLAWVEFVNSCKELDAAAAMVHGAALVYIDTLGANPSAMLAAVSGDLEKDRISCLKALGELFGFDAVSIYYSDTDISVTTDILKIGPFSLQMGQGSRQDPSFALDAPTTVANSIRIARGLQSTKPILLEGSPGVGKTTLVTALAQVLGKPLTRINLSEETDLTDLFGSDVPVEGSDMGHFAWRDAPFLRAMQKGEWVLLDEMNLASQSILEGLNSCLDHRRQVYVAELDQVFERHADFVLFAAQNPHHQGGGRKGLPASFVNRFTVVYADSFSVDDLKKICQKLSPIAPQEEIERLVEFISRLNFAVLNERTLGTIGGPWEINLRDLSRWLRLLERTPVRVSPSQFLDVAISHRFRLTEDRDRVSTLYTSVFGAAPDPKSLFHNLHPESFQVGLGVLTRNPIIQNSTGAHVPIVPSDLAIMESLIVCIDQAWPSILVGPSGCGKTTILRKLAAMNGSKLVELALNADTDTMDLIGGFEQVDTQRHVLLFVEELSKFVRSQIVQIHASPGQAEFASQLVKLYLAAATEPLLLEPFIEPLTALARASSDPTFNNLRDRCVSLHNLSKAATTVGFEWTEGLFIQAVQEGHWVVLDNANLCNSSVLDRLNSLMEPNGSLIINEQRTGDGSAKVVTPHPDFRLFLTMDPRHGELSRAMRNRAIEICFLPDANSPRPDSKGLAYTSESSAYRLRQCLNLDLEGLLVTNSQETFDVAVSHLAMSDIHNLRGASDQSLDLCGPEGKSADGFVSAFDRYASLPEANLSLLRGIQLQNGLDVNESKPNPIDGDLEPLHPLVNEPRLVASVESALQPHVIQLAKLHSLHLDLLSFQQTLSQESSASSSKKPSEMNRIERSIASKRIPALMKDSTQPLASFLFSCGQGMYDAIQKTIQSVPQSVDVIAVISSVLEFCQDLLRLSRQAIFDESIFQTYLQIGRSLHAESKHAQSELLGILSRALDSFHANWGLTTGQSMQRIWERWRPTTPTDAAHLKMMVDLQHLGSRFDKIALQVRMPFSELSRLRESLLRAQNTVLLGADGRSLFSDLDQVICSFENNIGDPGFVSNPFFVDEFEALCQYHDLDVTASADQSDLFGQLELLAGRPSRNPEMSTLGSCVPELLSRISRFSGFQHPSCASFALRGTVSLSLIDKLASLREVPLKGMSLLESELDVLGRGLCLSSQNIALNQVGLLRHQLIGLVKELLLCHRDLVCPGSFDQANRLLATADLRKDSPMEAKQPAFNLKLRDDLQDEHYFKDLTSDIFGGLSPLFVHYGSDENYFQAGVACVKVALACIRLFVPNRPFDPSLGLVVQRQQHAQRVLEKNEKLSALRTYEAHFSGQTSTLQIRLAEEELQLLGGAPPLPPVTRPLASRMGELQGEFANLLNSVLKRDPENIVASSNTDHSTAVQEAGLLQSNIRQICSRLSDNYKEYDDVVIPVVRFLQLLDIGISLVQYSKLDAHQARSPIHAVQEITPFLGGGRFALSKLEQNAARIKDRELQVHQLSVLSAAHTIDRNTLFIRPHRQALSGIIDRFYLVWKEELKRDQSNEAVKSSLYRYQGSAEDEEEADANEFHELFPTYDDDSDTTQNVSPPQLDTKALSSKLSSLLTQIFNPNASPDTTLRQLLKDATQLLGTLSKHRLSDPVAEPKTLLPGVVLLLEEANSPVPSGSYNFYDDANITEIKKLVEVVEATRSRFGQLQKSWPEHATLADVLNCCIEIFEFKHQDPLAKFITKAEKLHGFIYQWQQVASREFSAAQCYNDLTALLINWRRIELSTWARLLDIEKEKCEKDATAWFFIAYENIVASPVALLQNGDEIANHSGELLAALEKFISSTPMGQFASRLRLIEQLKSLLELYCLDLPGLKQVVSAVENLLRHYGPYAPLFDKALSDGRQPLEREIQQAIQLASWKDTNITALRESARRHHHKLFKVVRKYRTLLSQPSESILVKELPEIPSNAEIALNSRVNVPTSVASDVVDICRANVQLWEQRAPRFRDPGSAVQKMQHVYKTSLHDFQPPELLDGLLRDVIESMNDFKSRTPKSLTEENKEEVQHLKALKRRFYAEKLRTLQHMGVRSALGTDILEKQKSVASILSSTPSFGASINAPQIGSADSYFHRLLELIQRVRLASRTYCEDLSNVEVARSINSVESLLHWILKQRETLSSRLGELQPVQLAVQELSNVSRAYNSQLHTNPHVVSKRGEIQRALRWLSPIVGVCTSLLQIHGKFAHSDPSEVVQGLTVWKGKLDNALISVDGLTTLPPGLSSRDHAQHISEARSLVSNLRGDISIWLKTYPAMGFALEQVLPWTDLDASGDTQINGFNGELTVEDFDSNLLAGIDKMFVTLQRISECLLTSPSSTEDRGWLSKIDQALSKALLELHMPDITETVNSALSQLQLVAQSGPDTLRTAAAAVATIMPIAQQYHAICTSITDQYVALHREMCKMAYVLAKSFTQIASEGFCSPSESSTEQGKGEKLESGTGLGEGEGAEDISKDVQDDEDLTDLAQEKQQEGGGNEDMEDVEDAVNMDQEDLEADKSDFEQEKEKDEENASDSEDDADQDLDEEVGSVDGLDPGAVDEKLWDGENKEDEKDAENEQGKGTQSDEKTAASDEKKEDNKEQAEEQEGEGEEEGFEAPDEESEAVGRNDMDITDPQAKEEEALELPEEMELDGGDKGDTDSGLDDDLDGLSDEEDNKLDDQHEVQEEPEDAGAPESPSNEAEGDEDMEGSKDAAQPDEPENTEEPENNELEQEDGVMRAEKDDRETAGDDIAPSEAVSGGLGADQDQNEERGASGDASQDRGAKEQNEQPDEQTGTADEGDEGKQARNAAGGKDNDSMDDSQVEAFKKLGDILEEWHRRQRQIKDASDQTEEVQKETEDVDMEGADFEHLADDQDVADTQALGQASEEQAKGFDDNKAVESETKAQNDEFLPDSAEPEDTTEPDTLEDQMQLDQKPMPSDNNGPKSFVAGDSRGTNTDERANQAQEAELEDVDTHLSELHVSSDLTPLTPPEEARRLWSHYESVTHDLSLSLTEQLRLILAPTLATKLRGDFRTGKRLNIKRIIPYIASQYKRDKIWMRRSIPSKRNYQIMLAVDDSKSMLESGSGQLAFETLALVAKSLSMLEAGDLCVVGFGNEDHVRVAHEFGKPFSSDAGVHIFQQFSYKQTGTNVRRLIADSLALFREAKAKQSRSSSGGDLWQLQLIISDGICEDHETIRRLVRQAQEERIMIVFIIVDAVKGSSILDLTQANFEPDEGGTGEMKLKMKRYLEGFPFPYYLVVRDVQELPAVLSLALKQWFAEVVDVSG